MIPRPRHYARFIRFAGKVWAALRASLLYLASLARAASVSALSGDDQAQSEFLAGLTAPGNAGGINVDRSAARASDCIEGGRGLGKVPVAARGRSRAAQPGHRHNRSADIGACAAGCFLIALCVVVFMGIL